MKRHGGDIYPIDDTRDYVHKAMARYARTKDYRMLNLANKITLARILAIPFIVVLLYFPNRVSCLVAMLVFIVASLTDIVDGIVARRKNLVTNFGKLLDPLADKLLISSVFIVLVQLHDISGRPWVPAWVAIIIICRELVVTGLRGISAEKGLVLAADRFGKLKTFLQVLALCPLVLHHHWFSFDPRPIGEILLYIVLLMTVFSGGNYLMQVYRNWRQEENIR
ncbi:CDP-diacylglycerol--glycerol-3-phosphate 3-phosphatidyltransferase [Desulfovibrionales bacterium]